MAAITALHEFEINQNLSFTAIESYTFSNYGFDFPFHYALDE